MQPSPHYLTADDIIDRFAKPRRKTGGYTALCPAHDDRNASLVISDGTKGTLVHCHAGCSTVEVLAAVGLGLDQLFAEWRGDANTARISTQLEGYAEIQRLIREAKKVKASKLTVLDVAFTALPSQKSRQVISDSDWLEMMLAEGADTKATVYLSPAPDVPEGYHEMAFTDVPMVVALDLPQVTWDLWLRGIMDPFLEKGADWWTVREAAMKKLREKYREALR